MPLKPNPFFKVLLTLKVGFEAGSGSIFCCSADEQGKQASQVRASYTCYLCCQLEYERHNGGVVAVGTKQGGEGLGHGSELQGMRGESL